MNGKLFRDIALYLIVVLIIATAANFVPTRHIPWWGQGIEPPTAGVDFTIIDPVSADAIRTSFSNVAVLDTRSLKEFTTSHVPGAVLISYTDINRDLTNERLATLKDAQAIIIYGSSSETDIEQLVAQVLRRREIKMPYVLADGFDAWLAAGLPCEGDKS